MTSSNGNIFCVTGPLCGEFTGPSEFPTQRPVTRSFDVFFDLRLNKRLSKQLWGWWFETLSWSLWRHCNQRCLVAFTWGQFQRKNNHSNVIANYKFTHSGIKARMFCENKVNIMAADALAPCSITRPSAAVLMTVWDKQVLVFHDEKFQLAASS